MTTPLQGLKVLDLSRVLAGPWCAQLLGDLGADVVKVELPGRGDDSRQFGIALAPENDDKGRDSSFFLACNRNKRSVVVDMTTPEGMALVRDLALQADVLIENFKAGGMRKFGLDYATLQPLNPRLVYCSVTGFGQDGPYAPRPAYDFIMQAMSGMMSTCGQPLGVPGSEPMRTAIPTTDLVTGFNATIGVLGALIQRGVTGRGQFVDAAMLDASVAFNVHLAQGFLMNGLSPQRCGNGNPIASPSEVFETQDGWMVVAAGNDRQYANLCAALDLNERVQDPRFLTNALRVTHRAALRALITAQLVQQPTAHWLTVLSAAQVPATAINDMAQTFADPQVQHRQMTVEVAHGSGRNLPILRSAVNLSDAPVSYRAPPQLGQHTSEVLTQWLGLDAAAQADLRERNTISGL
jgi:crotonobetainyl-CoA:carnitine CoA-transferase CaiB-like acyl-CoA transferase